MPLTDEQKQEIAAERGETRPTGRARVPALEEILYEAVPCSTTALSASSITMGDDGAIDAGGAGLLRPRHPAGERGQRASSPT